MAETIDVNQNQGEVTPTPRKRMPEQDVAKGIAILGVVLFHILYIHKDIYAIFAGSMGFVMSMFFFLSGYNYKPGRTYKENVLRRVKNLLVPFLIYVSVIIISLGAYFLIKGTYSFEQIINAVLYSFTGSKFVAHFGILRTDIADLVFAGIRVSWFVIMLFGASLIFYAVVDLALKNIKWFISINAALLAVTIIVAFINYWPPLYIAESFTIASIMIFGAMFKKYHLFEIRNTLIVVLTSIGAYLTYIVMQLFLRGSGLMIAGNMINHFGQFEGLLVLLYAVIGSYAFVNFCKLVVKVKALRIVFTFLGNNSAQLLLLHSFVFVILGEIFHFDAGIVSISAEYTDWMKFLYAFMTIIIVIGYIFLLMFIKKKIKSRKENKTLTA